MNDVLALTQDLIARCSVTPDDAGCQAVLAERLQRAGFHCEHLRYGQTDNLWATHGTDWPVLCAMDVGRGTMVGSNSRRLTFTPMPMTATWDSP